MGPHTTLCVLRCTGTTCGQEQRNGIRPSLRKAYASTTAKWIVKRMDREARAVRERGTRERETRVLAMREQRRRRKDRMGEDKEMRPKVAIYVLQHACRVFFPSLFVCMQWRVNAARNWTRSKSACAALFAKGRVLLFSVCLGDRTAFQIRFKSHRAIIISTEIITAR